MYEPKFNSVLVEIDDKDAEWGNGNDESMLGKSYRFGTVISVAEIFSNTDKFPITGQDCTKMHEDTADLIDKQIMWNEGVEAGTVFEHDGKQYGFIYWWDIRGVKS